MRPDYTRSEVNTVSHRFTEEATLLYWLFVENKKGDRGKLRIYDGHDANGTLKCTIVADAGLPVPFDPAIYCEDGLYVEIVEKVTSYTIGYLTEDVAERG